MKMRSAVLTAKREVMVEYHDIPQLDNEHILVKIHACGLCTWERRAYQGVHHVDYPFLGGHEMAGEIIAVPKQYQSMWKPHDKVVIGGLQPCRSCYFCKHHQEEACLTFDELKTMPKQPYHGQAGLSEYQLVKPESLFKYDGVSYEEACMSEPLACVIQSVEAVNPQFGDTCVIIGAGIMGLLHVQLCVKKGTQVIVVDEKEDRLQLAKALGAHHVINFAKESVEDRIKNDTDQIKAQAVFDTTPSAEVFENCLSYVSRGGKIMIYSGIYPNKKLEIDPHWIHKNSIQILGTANANDISFTKAAFMISHHIVDVTPFISGVYTIDHVKEAFEATIQHDCYRNIITFT